MSNTKADGLEDRVSYRWQINRHGEWKTSGDFQTIDEAQESARVVSESLPPHLRGEPAKLRFIRVKTTVEAILG